MRKRRVAPSCTRRVPDREHPFATLVDSLQRLRGLVLGHVDPVMHDRMPTLEMDGEGLPPLLGVRAFPGQRFEDVLRTVVAQVARRCLVMSEPAAPKRRRQTPPNAAAT